MISINNHGGEAQRVHGVRTLSFMFHTWRVKTMQGGCNFVLLICKSSLCRCASAAIIVVNLFSHVSTILLVFELSSDKANLTKEKVKFDSWLTIFKIRRIEQATSIDFSPPKNYLFKRLSTRTEGTSRKDFIEAGIEGFVAGLSATN